MAVLIVLTVAQLTYAVAYAIDALDAARWSSATVRDGIDDGSSFAVYTSVSVVMLLAWVGAGVLFVRRSRRFPGVLTVLLVLWFVMLLVHVMLYGVHDVTLPVHFLLLALMTSYVRRSRRVKTTFVDWPRDAQP
jgi:hypothetical protein